MLKYVDKLPPPDFRSDPALLPKWLAENKTVVLCEDEMQFYDLVDFLKDSRTTWVWRDKAEIWRSYCDYHLSGRDGKRDMWLPGLAVSVERSDGKNQNEGYSVGWCYRKWYENEGFCVVTYRKLFGSDVPPDLGELF